MIVVMRCAKDTGAIVGCLGFFSSVESAKVALATKHVTKNDRGVTVESTVLKQVTADKTFLKFFEGEADSLGTLPGDGAKEIQVKK